VRLSASDYALVVAGHGLAPLLRQVGDLETALAARRLAGIAVERPVFVAGLARSGTTVLTEVLARIPGVATHRYRDFPFLFTPLIWNWAQDRLAADSAPVERPHRDRIRITRESAEAFEEPIWQHFFPQVHDPERLHVLDADARNADFEDFYRDHIRKILSIRGGTRYVSKGNYNVTRIAYLARLFPDARFIVPIREPVAQVRSLVRQHRLFCEYGAADARIGAYLRAAGHYEFGPQRQPINVTREGAGRVREAWRKGDEARGYAAMWADIYAHVDRLAAPSSPIADRIAVLRYEDFCADPHATLSRLLEFAGFIEAGEPGLEDLGAISAPPRAESDLSRDVRDAIEEETAAIAGRFGYGGG
jgi:hypothetical protein